jgi:CRP-like cAMP-binding protein
VAGAAILVLLPPILLPTLTHWFMIGAGACSFGLAAWLAFRNYGEMRGSIHAEMWAAAAIGFSLGAASFVGDIQGDRAGAGFGLYEAGSLISTLLFVFAGRLLRGVSGSWRTFSFGLLALTLIVWGASLFIEDVSARTFVGLLSLSSLLHWKMRPAMHAEKTRTGEVLESTRQRIVQAFQNIRLVVLSELETDFGAQTRKRVENGEYGKATALFGRAKKLETADYHSTLTGMTPDDYGGALALNLEELLIGVEKAAGRTYAIRALAYGFDRLDWEQQEIAEDHLLKYVAHAAGLSRQLKGTRHDVESLVRSVPLFMSMNDQGIASLSKQWRTKRFERGETILRQGEPGEAFYLIGAGSVEVTQRFDPHQKQSPVAPLISGTKDQVMIIARNRKLVTLGRGDYFGEAAVLSGGTCNATVQAVTPVEMLWLNRQDFDTFVRDHFDAQGKAQTTLRRLSVLRQIPLFAEFESRELSLLDQKLERLNVYPGDTIFQYGEAGSDFYIIESGKVSVQIPFTDAEGATQVAERAALGTGEYFGELSLLMDAPRSATVVASKPTVLLRLDARTFREILDQSRNMKQALERAGSRRVLSNERWARSLAGT